MLRIVAGQPPGSDQEKYEALRLCRGARVIHTSKELSDIGNTI